MKSSSSFLPGVRALPFFGIPHQNGYQQFQQSFGGDRRVDFPRRNCVIEFLKSLQVLSPGTRDLIVDEKFCAREWPPKAPTE